MARVPLGPREAAVCIEQIMLKRINKEGSLSEDERAQISDAADHLRKLDNGIPMILFCPSCNGRHIDEGEFATRSHHTHACQKCGLVWRPAIYATMGVQFLPGFKNGNSK